MLVLDWPEHEKVRKCKFNRATFCISARGTAKFATEISNFNLTNPSLLYERLLNFKLSYTKPGIIVKSTVVPH